MVHCLACEVENILHLKLFLLLINFFFAITSCLITTARQELYRNAFFSSIVGEVKPQDPPLPAIYTEWSKSLKINLNGRAFHGVFCQGF